MKKYYAVVTSVIGCKYLYEADEKTIKRLKDLLYHQKILYRCSVDWYDTKEEALEFMN